jgi:hypothetical protein
VYLQKTLVWYSSLVLAIFLTTLGVAFFIVAKLFCLAFVDANPSFAFEGYLTPSSCPRRLVYGLGLIAVLLLFLYDYTFAIIETSLLLPEFRF